MNARNVVVVGGSLGGLFAGVLLRGLGRDVTIGERSARGLGGRGAGLVGQPDIFAILREVGCEDAGRIGVVARERIVLDRGGNAAQRVAAAQTQLSWDRIHDAFRERFPDTSYRLGAEAIAVRDRGDWAEVELADGCVLAADLVLGAEGAACRAGFARSGRYPHNA